MLDKCHMNPTVVSERSTCVYSDVDCLVEFDLCAYAIAEIFIVCRTCFVSFKGIYFGRVNRLFLMVK